MSTRFSHALTKSEQKSEHWIQNYHNEKKNLITYSFFLLLFCFCSFSSSGLVSGIGLSNCRGSYFDQETFWSNVWCTNESKNKCHLNFSRQSYISLYLMLSSLFRCLFGLDLGFPKRPKCKVRWRGIVIHVDGNLCSNLWSFLKIMSLNSNPSVRSHLCWDFFQISQRRQSVLYRDILIKSVLVPWSPSEVLQRNFSRTMLTMH